MRGGRDRFAFRPRPAGRFGALDAALSLAAALGLAAALSLAAALGLALILGLALVFARPAVLFW